MNLTYNNTPQLQEANAEVVIHNVEGDEKIDIKILDFLRPASPLFSPLPSTKPVLFIPGPGSQNQMFGLASVHNG